MALERDPLRGIVTRKGQEYLVRGNLDAHLDALQNPEALRGAGAFKPTICPTCNAPRGLEPVYPLEIAAAMVPFESVGAARVWLHSNPKVVEPMYKKIRARWHRYLSITDICKIRRVLFNPFRRGHPPGAIEAKIVRFANKLDVRTAANDILADAMRPVGEKK